MASSINASITSTGIVQSADASGILELQSNGITGLTVNGSNVSISGNLITTGPAFSAYASSATTLSTGTFAKIGFQTEVFDTNNNFSSSRFTPTVAGYYQINSCICFGSSAAAQSDAIAIYKNGLLYQIGPYVQDLNNQGLRVAMSSLVYCDGSTDYIEIYGIYNAGPATQNIQTGSTNTWVNGCLVRSA